MANETITKIKARKMTPKEITLVYLVFCLFFTLVGYIYADITTELVKFDFSGIESPGIGYIFLNNITFFSIVCVTPFINFIMFAIQFISIGNNIYEIHSLSINMQIIILYRHAILEIVALLLSVFVSYNIYNIMYEYLYNSKKASKSSYIKIIIAYITIFILTLIGACMEGTVNV